MTKTQLVTFIMENTMEFKKTHLVEKYKSELEEIAAKFQVAEIDENGTDGESAPAAQPKVEIVQPSAEVENGTSAPWLESESQPENEESSDPITKIILATYEENKKSVKARRIDKDEFKRAVVDTVTAKVAADGPDGEDTIKALTISIMSRLSQNLIAFCPMNDNERKMLETIPLLADYENPASEVNGKNFLQKVKELHNIEVSTSRALMVSLKRKQFITIGGGRKTFIVLLERGKKHLGISA